MGTAALHAIQAHTHKYVHAPAGLPLVELREGGEVRHGYVLVVGYGCGKRQGGERRTCMDADATGNGGWSVYWDGRCLESSIMARFRCYYYSLLSSVGVNAAANLSDFSTDRAIPFLGACGVDLNGFGAWKKMERNENAQITVHEVIFFLD